MSQRPFYAFATVVLLVCCGPIGLVPLWLGPWSSGAKIAITVVWLVFFGPATFFYLGRYYHPSGAPTPTP